MSDCKEIREALLALVYLKEHKDQFGKTDYYLLRQPKAWSDANKALKR